MVITMGSYALQTPPRVVHAKPPGPNMLCSVGNVDNSATVCSVGNSNNICLIFVPATRFVLIWVSFQIVSLHFMAALEIQGGHEKLPQTRRRKYLHVYMAVQFNLEIFYYPKKSATQ